MDTELAQFVRSIKGPSLSILVVFILERRPIGHNFIVSASGYSKNTVTQALKDLANLGLIEPVPGQRYDGWVVADRVPIIFGIKSSPIFCDSPFPPTLLGMRDDNFQIVDSGYEHRREMLSMLHDAGIRGSYANRIVLDSSITLEYVEQMIRDNHSSPTLLVHKILRHEKCQ